MKILIKKLLKTRWVNDALHWFIFLFITTAPFWAVMCSAGFDLNAHECAVWKHMEESFTSDGGRYCPYEIQLWKKYKEDKWYGIFYNHERIHITRFYIEDSNCTELFNIIRKKE